MKRTIIGKVVRKADLFMPDRKQITVEIKSTTIDSHTMTLGGTMTFEICTFGIEKCPFKDALYNLQKEDNITVEFEKVDGKLNVVDLKHAPNLGVCPEEWFDNYEKELEYWKKKGALK